jgi:hypothetical protein
MTNPSLVPVDPPDVAPALAVSGSPWRPAAGVVALARGSAGFLSQALRLVSSTWEWTFGAITLIVALAVLAAIPVLQFLSLGYLLEAGGRVARTGRLRSGFIGVRQAARVGSIVLGTWLMLLPLRLVSSLATAAQLIDPNGQVARGWRLGLLLLTSIMTLHIVVAWSRGGRLRHFLWPFGNPLWLVRRLWRGGYYAEARDAVWDFVMSLRLPHYFWLGVRGFVGGFAWLVVPISLLVVARVVPPAGVAGAILLALVLCYVPYLQVRFAAEGRFGALFEVGVVRWRFARAPWAFAFALLVALAFALPLYLLKIELVPREVAWLPGLLFIVFIFPARLLAGWAWARAGRRAAPRHWVFRWMARLGLVPVVLLYVIVVYFSQFTGWSGVWGLYEQHAFLLPVPFVGM